jgi:hypothetical protein
MAAKKCSCTSVPGTVRVCKECGMEWCSSCARRGKYGTAKGGPTGDRCPSCGGPGTLATQSYSR